VLENQSLVQIRSETVPHLVGRELATREVE